MERRLAVVSICIAMLAPVAAMASFPDLFASTMPDCIAVCPDGDLPSTGVLRDVGGAPCAGFDVRMIFGPSCVDLRELPPPCTQPTVLMVTSNNNGEFTFFPEVGGCCLGNAAVVVEVDPGAVTFAVYDEVSSVDWAFDVGIGAPAMDARVDIRDFVEFQANFLGVDQCHDYPTGVPPMCDDTTNLADFTLFAAHFLHGPGGCP